MRRLRAAGAISLIAGVLAGCGGSNDEPPQPVGGKTVRGETETGMKMTVETFVSPAKDPELKKLDDYRRAGRYPDVDYHRVLADNSAGQVADMGRTITFARSDAEMNTGRGVAARFSCDALAYEWVPTQPGQDEPWRALRESLCADGPPKQEGIAPGAKKTYYLVTDRGFAERGIREMRVFGPRNAEFSGGR